MTPTAALWGLVEQEELWVAYRDLRRMSWSRLVLGLYVRAGHRGMILLDRSLVDKPRLLRSVLAEEIGHHLTVGEQDAMTAYMSYSRRVALSRDEARAIRWACDALLPEPGVRTSLRRGATISDLAEEFEVTEWLVHRRLEFMGAAPLRRSIVRLAASQVAVGSQQAREVMTSALLWGYIR
ncbi:MAG: ImmA/IrrE family metallo-endopeptidase [Clostridia bacterium]|nr:ImmA/IrrE family metallo-endopeptidase [Clostridia bacterium]